MTTEKIYHDHINEWCAKCKNESMAKNCKECFLDDISDEGKIGQPKKFEEK